MRRAMLTHVATPTAVPITYRTPTVARVTATTSITINKPTGTAVGDLLRVVLLASGRTWNVLSGWAIVPGTSAGPDAVALYRVATGAEGSSFNFSITGGSTILLGGMACTTGIDPADPFDVSSFTNPNGSFTSFVAPSVTVVDGTHLDSLLLLDSNEGVTKPAPMTLEFLNTSARPFAGAHQSVTAGATGTRTWTVADTSGGAAVLCALRPVSP